MLYDNGTCQVCKAEGQVIVLGPFEAPLGHICWPCYTRGILHVAQEARLNYEVAEAVKRGYQGG